MAKVLMLKQLEGCLDGELHPRVFLKDGVYEIKGDLLKVVNEGEYGKSAPKDAEVMEAAFTNRASAQARAAMMESALLADADDLDEKEATANKMLAEVAEGRAKLKAKASKAPANKAAPAAQSTATGNEGAPAAQNAPAAT